MKPKKKLEYLDDIVKGLWDDVEKGLRDPPEPFEIKPLVDYRMDHERFVPGNGVCDINQLHGMRNGITYTDFAKHIKSNPKLKSRTGRPDMHPRQPKLPILQSSEERRKAG